MATMNDAPIATSREESALAQAEESESAEGSPSQNGEAEASENKEAKKTEKLRENRKTERAHGKPTLRQMIAGLKKDPAPRHLKTKKQGGQSITYMPWAYICDYLDHYTKDSWAWNYDREVVDGVVYFDGFLMLHGSDGRVTRMASGSCEASDTSFGEPVTKAEAQALRRAAAKFGFCRSLWKKS